MDPMDIVGKTKEDASLPKATMTKIIKEMLPPDVCVARDAQDLLIECCVGAASTSASAFAPVTPANGHFNYPKVQPRPRKSTRRALNFAVRGQTREEAARCTNSTSTMSTEVGLAKGLKRKKSDVNEPGICKKKRPERGQGSVSPSNPSLVNSAGNKQMLQATRYFPSIRDSFSSRVNDCIPVPEHSSCGFQGTCRDESGSSHHKHRSLSSIMSQTQHKQRSLSCIMSQTYHKQRSLSCIMSETQSLSCIMSETHHKQQSLSWIMSQPHHKHRHHKQRRLSCIMSQTHHKQRRLSRIMRSTLKSARSKQRGLSCQTETTSQLVDAITKQSKNLDINRNNSAAPLPYGRDHMNSSSSKAHIPYGIDGTVIPFDGSSEFIKKKPPRPKVDLDEQTTRAWKPLLENSNNEWSEDERRVFHGRTESFIARMHLVQGNRRFSPWKGSVVDSVVGVFLTQNVSDHLSSSAFMSLASDFLLKPESKYKSCREEKSISKIREPIVSISDPEESVTWTPEMPNTIICDQSSMNCRGVELDEEREVDNNESPRSRTGISSIETGLETYYESTANKSTREKVETNKICYIDEERTSINDGLSSHNSVVSEDSSLPETAERKGSRLENNKGLDNMGDRSSLKKMNDTFSFMELLQNVCQRNGKASPDHNSKGECCKTQTEGNDFERRKADCLDSCTILSGLPVASNLKDPGGGCIEMITEGARYSSTTKKVEKNMKDHSTVGEYSQNSEDSPLPETAERKRSCLENNTGLDNMGGRASLKKMNDTFSFMELLQNVCQRNGKASPDHNSKGECCKTQTEGNDFERRNDCLDSCTILSGLPVASNLKDPGGECIEMITEGARYSSTTKKVENNMKDHSTVGEYSQNSEDSPLPETAERKGSCLENNTGLDNMGGRASLKKMNGTFSFMELLQNVCQRNGKASPDHNSNGECCKTQSEGNDFQRRNADCLDSFTILSGLPVASNLKDMDGGCIKMITEGIRYSSTTKEVENNMKDHSTVGEYSGQIAQQNKSAVESFGQFTVENKVSNSVEEASRSPTSNNSSRKGGGLTRRFQRTLMAEFERSLAQEQNTELLPNLSSGNIHPVESTSEYDRQDKNPQKMTQSDLVEHASQMKELNAKRKAKSRRVGRELKDNVNWDALRKEAEADGMKREKTKNSMDSVDWEAVRCADINEIANTIKERGMNNMLAERIKDFLNRLVKEHGSIDLEWLRDVPPDDANEYLLSIRGLGLKSVECVRLLTLHHLAFPVDTNVGRIAVRLGWVPLQPLPESLQLHLLELYPVQESIQKYLWPRLCKLNQRTLYELHYQMITFGKVFCTKSKPNCNACPMRGECRHFASAFASARLALPGPEEKSIVGVPANRTTGQTPPIMADPLLLPPPLPPVTKGSGKNQLTEAYEVSVLKWQDYNCEPIVEVPLSPEPEQTQVTERDIEDTFCEDPDEIPIIKLNIEQFTQNVKSYMQENMDLPDHEMSKALVALTAEAASFPMPKLKNVSRLRTEHQVYELPDFHPILQGLEQREPDDPCPYLLAIWTPGEIANSIQPRSAEGVGTSQQEGKFCGEKTCFSCNSVREENYPIVRGTLLIPCRTAMRGSFPLNGTYFQVNEVFADHDSSQNPIEVPRDWIWNLQRRTVYFGTSVPTIFKGLTREEIQQCFWRGFVCVRGFDQKIRAPRPLNARLHFRVSKLKGNPTAGGM